MLNKLMTGMIGAGVAMVLANFSIYLINPGEQSLIMDQIHGLKPEVKGPGYHLRIPIIQNVIIYDCRLKLTEIHVTTGTKDMQTVNITLKVLQRPVVQNLQMIHQLLGINYEKKVFNSIGQEVLRTIVAQYDADQLLKFRETISKEIKTMLCAKALGFNVNVQEVSFSNLSFSPEYAKAVERRAVQQQLAQMQKFVVLRDQQLKNAQIIRSQAQAEAAKLINNAVKSYGPTQIQIKKLQAALNIAQIISKNPNITFVPSSSQANLLNLRI